MSATWRRGSRPLELAEPSPGPMPPVARDPSWPRRGALAGHSRGIAGSIRGGRLRSSSVMDRRWLRLGVSMRFALLGPLVVVSDSGQQASLTGPRLRVLLTALLLRANRPVSAHALAEAVWDGKLPPAAMDTLRSYVRRLRRALGPEGGALIEARYPGYLIRLEGAELDVLEFETLCLEAAAALRAAACS